METMKFKTSAKCGGCEAAIRHKFIGLLNGDQWSLDLNSPDKVLTVTADVSPEEVIEAVKDAGFQIELLKD